VVYGGHTIGLALSHVVRALPNLVTVGGWRSCDHLAPVFEGDVLRSVVTVGEVLFASGPSAALVELHVETAAARVDTGERAQVLDWKLLGVMAP
jgi:acyl dehydratase